VVAIVGFPDVEALDVVGPAQVFAAASDPICQRSGDGPPAYRVELCAVRGGRLATSSGVELVARRSIRAVAGPVDTLIVAGGRGVTSARHDARLPGWIRRTARHARRICSVCAGAFVLAEAGLLRSRRVATHWRLCSELASRCVVRSSARCGCRQAPTGRDSA
jgi:transcriptional regulator GlxA family with amidase domain